LLLLEILRGRGGVRGQNNIFRSSVVKPYNNHSFYRIEKYFFGEFRVQTVRTAKIS